MFEDEEDDHFHDFYNHPPPASAAADAINDANQDALLQQISALKLLMKTNTDQESLAVQASQLNVLLTQFAIGRRLRFGQIPW